MNISLILCVAVVEIQSYLHQRMPFGVNTLSASRTASLALIGLLPAVSQWRGAPSRTRAEWPWVAAGSLAGRRTKVPLLTLYLDKWLMSHWRGLSLGREEEVE